MSKIKECIKGILGLNKKVYTANKNYKLIVSEELILKDKVVAITGGAGAIGKATAMKMVAEGATVYILGRNKDKLLKTTNEVEQKIRNRGCIKYKTIDVSNNESIEKVFEEIIEEERKIDVLVNLAGGGARGEAKDLMAQSVEIIDDVINTNLRGSILCAKAVLDKMVEQKYGKIINISSTIGINGMEHCCDYSAAKSGIFGFTKSLAKEVGKYGINVNCITPGLIQRGEFTIIEAENLKESNYLNTIGELEDIANAINFFATDESKFITGQNLIVDGGRSLGLKSN